MTTLYGYWLNIKAMLNNRKGQGMVEYILIIAFIALIVLVALTPLGQAIAAKFTEVKDSL